MKPKNIALLLAIAFITFIILFPRKLANLFQTPPPPPILRYSSPFVFGLISDIQYSDVADGKDMDSGKPRRHRESLQKLRFAVRDWRRAGAKMVIDLGDILDSKSARFDRRQRDLDDLEKELANLTVPYYHLLGNHDLFNYDFDEWRRLTRYKFRQSMPSGDFRLSLSPFPSWRFLFLNSFEFGVMGRANESRVSQEAWRVLRRRNRNRNPNSAEGLGEGAARRRWTAYNAALGREQLAWIERELERAERNRERVVVFTHIPLHPKVRAMH